MKVKAKPIIPLADAKVDTIGPPSTTNDSSPQGSVVSGWSCSLLSTPNPNKFDFHITLGEEQHEFKCECEEDETSWVKLLGLLVLFPTTHIPEEPLDNPIKDSFRNKLRMKDFKAVVFSIIAKAGGYTAKSNYVYSCVAVWKMMLWLALNPWKILL